MMDILTEAFAGAYGNAVSVGVDIVLLGLLVLFTVIGAKKGLVRMVLWLAVLGVSVLGSLHLTRLLNDGAADWLFPKVEDKMEAFVDNFRMDLEGFDLDKLEFTGDGKLLTDESYALLLTNPGMAKTASGLARFGMSEEQIREKLSSIMAKVQKAGSSAKEVLSRSAQELCYSSLHAVVRVVMLIVFFLLLSAVLSWLVKKINAVIFRIPLLGFINGLGGAALGLINVCAVIFFALYILGHIGIEGFPELTADTFLLKLAVQYNPVSMFFS